MLGNCRVFGLDIQIWMLAFAGIFIIYGATHLLLHSRNQRL
jgi:hypothetical protein